MLFRFLIAPLSHHAAFASYKSKVLVPLQRYPFTHKPGKWSRNPSERSLRVKLPSTLREPSLLCEFREAFTAKVERIL